MSNPIAPNFNPQTGGQLVTSRYEYQTHINGTGDRHNATQIDLSPSVVIGGNSMTTTQEAITALATIIAPAVPVLATSTVPGQVQLSTTGDVQGTALSLQVVKLRGFAINTATPATNNVLTWNGTAWGPAVPASFTAANDLAGNNVSQQVVGLTGDTTTNPGFHTIRSSADYIQFISTAVPTINQTSVNGNGATMTIRSQTATGSSHTGGNLVLSSGDGTATLPTGSLTLSVGTPGVANGSAILQVLKTHTGGAGNVGFFPPNNINVTSTDMPSGAGDYVIYIGNCNSLPSTPSPTGAILYSSGGALNIMQSNGSVIPISNVLNPVASTAVASGSLPATAIPTSGEITYYVTATSTLGAPGTMFTFAHPPECCSMFEVRYIAKEIGTAGFLIYRMTQGYVRNGSGAPATAGSQTVYENQTTIGGSPTRPAIPAIISNTIVVTTGYTGTSPVLYWTAEIKITLSSSPS